jgi:uncharacterized protein (TIGR02246 family)
MCTEPINFSKQQEVSGAEFQISFLLKDVSVGCKLKHHLFQGELKLMNMKAIFLLMTVCLWWGAGKGQSSQDKEAVKKVVILFQEDFNEGSFKNAAAYSTTDWEHINPGGGIDRGRDSVLKTVRAVHQTFLKGVTMQIESMDIRFLTPDVAIADVVHSVGNYTTPDGVKHENERQIKTYVVVKKKGKWLLAQDHNTVIQGANTATRQK